MPPRDEFRDLSLGLWKKLMDDLFPVGIPKSAQWTDLDSIGSVLKKVGFHPESNHMFFPTGGGLDLEGAEPFAEERGCLALKTGDHLLEVVKPSVLLFESVGSELEWTYFRLECEPLQPCGAYEDEETEEGEDQGGKPKSEEVVLVYPGTYAPRSVWDANEFEGEPLPETAILIDRFLSGHSFVIFSKGSLYNLGRSRNFDPYDAPHAQMDAAQFRQLVAGFAGVRQAS